jgi:hypothetical protein
MIKNPSQTSQTQRTPNLPSGNQNIQTFSYGKK